MKLYFLLCFIFTEFTTSSQIPRPLLSIPSGTIRGTFQKSDNGRTYAAFEGVPYARPPVGKYRFREPQPIKPWRGIWETNYLHKCLQYIHYIDAQDDRVIGSEDCLYINVYTPQLNQAAMLDVIVFIHGGAFMYGTGHAYGPTIIMNRDVVYVNFNYRLGPLGFLSTEDSVVSGNMGMKDQVLALKWIKNNIQYFGGNPESIMLSGMSAGGASVHLHYISPLSTGLFTRGFSLSGTALNPWVLTENSLEKTKKLADSLGCDTTIIKEMVECLRYRPARQLVQNVDQFFGFLYNPFSPFGVVVEPQATTGSKYVVEPFLTEHPYQALKSGKIQDLPWITSVTKAEGLYPASEFVSNENYLTEIETKWNELAPYLLDYNYTINVNQHNIIADKIKLQYLQGKAIDKSTFNNLVQIMGDRLFISDSHSAAKLQAQKNTFPVYFYYFTYRGAHSKSETLSKSNEDFGASHGDDCVYVLSSSTNTRSNTNDINMSEMLIDMWTSYAKTGVPNLNNVTWPRVNTNPEEPLVYLEINSPENVIEKSNADLGHMKFWHSLPFNENEHIVNRVKDEF